MGQRLKSFVTACRHHSGKITTPMRPQADRMVIHVLPCVTMCYYVLLMRYNLLLMRYYVLPCAPQATGAPAESDRAPALDVAIAEGGANWESLEEVPTGDELIGADRPLQRANKLLQARVSPFFRLLNERELELLALGSDYFIVRKGDALVVQGDSCESIYMVVRGIMRVLIGAKGAGKWGMHRIARNKPKTSSVTTNSYSPGSPGNSKEKAGRTSPASPHSPKEKAESPTLDSPVAGRTGHRRWRNEDGSNLQGG